MESPSLPYLAARFHKVFWYVYFGTPELPTMAPRAATDRGNIHEDGLMSQTAVRIMQRLSVHARRMPDIFFPFIVCAHGCFSVHGINN